LTPRCWPNLIDLFVEETPQRLAAIANAAAGANPQALAREAHALKGSSAHLGATRMYALCETLEEQGRAGSVRGVQPLMTVLEEEFDRVREALTREKDSK
jgi:HPt (histidine-containing phosphotransfer) domain-containing protein